MRQTLGEWVRRSALWCVRRLRFRHSSGVQVLALSTLAPHLRLIADRGVLSVVPAAAAGGRPVMTRPRGAAARILPRCRPVACLRPKDFGLPYAVLRTATGVQFFADAEDDLRPLLSSE